MIDTFDLSSGVVVQNEWRRRKNELKLQVITSLTNSIKSIYSVSHARRTSTKSIGIEMSMKTANQIRIESEQ